MKKETITSPILTGINSRHQMYSEVQRNLNENEERLNLEREKG